MSFQRRRLLAAGVVTAVAGGSLLGRVFAQPAEQVIHVTARKFAFLPAEIRLKKGVPVVLAFTAPEVVMGFSAPDLKVRTDIVPGEEARVRLVPQQIGKFDFLCDIFCGEGHEGMHGTIVVDA